MSIKTVNQSINKIIKNRQEKLGKVNESIDRLNKIKRVIKKLNSAVTELKAHPQLKETIKANLEEFEDTYNSWNGDIDRVLEKLNKAKNRCARKTVTIGCGGAMGAGKSTLLKTIGNLPEEAVPTGDGRAVTAVRSRLVNSNHTRAYISLRNKTTFFNKIIKPYQTPLKISLKSFEDFISFNANEIDPRAIDPHQALLNRFKGMSESLEYYEKFLTGGQKILEEGEFKDQLRPWVAYPEDVGPEEKAERLYLAVEKIEIHCPFVVDIKNLTLVDLPGLGEVSMEVDNYQTEGLANEVDLALMLVVPSADRGGFWNSQYQTAYNLMIQAAEGINQKENFVFFVMNKKPNVERSKYETLKKDINKQLNPNTIDKPPISYHILECKANNEESVREDLLLPVLKLLINTLPEMDQNIIDWALDEWQNVEITIQQGLSDLKKDLQNIPIQQGNRAFNKAKELRRNLAFELLEYIQTLEEENSREKEEGEIVDQSFRDQISEKYEEIKSWLTQQRLGQNIDDWNKEAIRSDDKQGGLLKFAINQMNYCRTHITDTYSELDEYFQTKIEEELLNLIGEIISRNTGNLISETLEGKEKLLKFQELLTANGVGDPFPSMRKATDYLLKCAFEKSVFQSHLLPIITRETRQLRIQSGEVTDLFVRIQNIHEVGDPKIAEATFNVIKQFVMEASNSVMKNLILNPFITDIFLSATIKFRDSLTIGNRVDEQFFDFVNLYSNEIGINDTDDLCSNHRTVKQLEESITELERIL